jgi:hypothetical protein
VALHDIGCLDGAPDSRAVGPALRDIGRDLHQEVLADIARVPSG